MSHDYYTTLGVSRDASQGDIKKAFYKKAQEYHPDKPTGDESKFKEVNEAYQVLGNEQKRAQYNQMGHAGFKGSGGGSSQNHAGFDFSGFQGGFGGIDLEDLFSDVFGGGYGRRVPRGRDIQIDVSLTFKEMALGVSKEVTIPDIKDGVDNNKNKKLTLKIPAGIEDGQQIRLMGHGEVLSNGKDGNLFVTLHVSSHTTLYRDGRDLVMDLDVKLTDAIRGTKVEVPGLEKDLVIKIPAGLRSGEVLRVRGEGICAQHRGDLLIKTHIVIPKKLSKQAKKAIDILSEEGY